MGSRCQELGCLLVFLHSAHAGEVSSESASGRVIGEKRMAQFVWRVAPDFAFEDGYGC
jgi:hypothetical protein